MFDLHQGLRYRVVEFFFCPSSSFLFFFATIYNKWQNSWTICNLLRAIKRSTKLEVTWSWARKAALKHPARLVWHQGLLCLHWRMSPGETLQHLLKQNLCKVSSLTYLFWVNKWFGFPGGFFTLFKITEQQTTCPNIYRQVFTFISQTWCKKKFDFSPANLPFSSVFCFTPSYFHS